MLQIKRYNNQSDLAKGRIAAAHLYLPVGSIGLTVWLKFTIACFGCKFDRQISPSTGFFRNPHLIQCVIGPTRVRARWYLNPSNGLSRKHECDRKTDRQTDGEMDRQNRLRYKVDSA